MSDWVRMGGWTDDEEEEEGVGGVDVLGSTGRHLLACLLVLRAVYIIPTSISNTHHGPNTQTPLPNNKKLTHHLPPQSATQQAEQHQASHPAPARAATPSSAARARMPVTLLVCRQDRNYEHEDGG